MSDLARIHKLLMESVNEENRKRKEIPDSPFKLNSKKNLIVIAKETLKSKNTKNNNIKLKNPSVDTKKITNLPKIILKQTKKKKNEKENVKNNLIFSDKEYLKLMLTDLKSISSSIKRKQRKYYPNYYNNLPLKNGNNYFSSGIKNRNMKIYNYKRANELNNFQTHNLNDIDLLNQIIGGQDEEQQTYENKVTITEDNLNFNDLYFGDTIKQVFYTDM